MKRNKALFTENNDMKQSKYMVSRASTTKAEAHLLESEFTTPRQYIDIRIFLFERNRQTWEDEESKGIETIEPQALNDVVLADSDFTIGIVFEGKQQTLLRCSKDNGAILDLCPDWLRVLLAVPNTTEGTKAVEIMKIGKAQGCSFSYRTNPSHSDFVELTKTTASPKELYQCSIKRIAEITGVTLLMVLRVNPDRLRDYCEQNTPIWQLDVYSIKHCDRVADNGKRLFVPGANPNVIIAFAYLHDIARSDSNSDPGHGERATQIIDEIRRTHLADFSDIEIRLLKDACRLHETAERTGNKTIDICLDADRLDLPRLGIIPTPEQMATEKGAQLAAELNSPAPA